MEREVAMVGHSFPQFIAEIFFVVWVLVVGLLAFGTLVAQFRLRSPARGTGRRDLPGISILKPLKGIDDGARENLESFFRSNYPRFELLFSVASESDPVIPLVRDLQLKYPHVASDLLVGDVKLGLNPKVNNLVRSYAAATFDNILISDSNTRVDSEFLLRLGSAFTPEASLLHCVVGGGGGESLGGRLDVLALNTVYARGSLLAAALGQVVVTGKAMLLRKSELENLGGLKALSAVIAEDYVAGQLFDRAGLRVRMHDEPIQQHVGRLSFRGFWSRNIRWGRIRKGHAPLMFFFIEPLLGSVTSGLMGALAFHSMGVSPLLFFPLHMSFWALNDLLLMRKLGGSFREQGFGRWLLREFLQLPLWLHISLGNSVTWRGQQYQLGARERREARI
jgi:ceramide glucosyltransferase